MPAALAALVEQVSIRSRLFSREIQTTADRQRRFREFQSAPGFLAGRYPYGQLQLGAGIGFQSAPGFLAGRYAVQAAPDRQITVSIRSRLFSREILDNDERRLRQVQFQSAPGFLAGRYHNNAAALGREIKFQSAPGFLAGRYPSKRRKTPLPQWFQSAPGFLAGRYSIISAMLAFSTSFNPLPAF